MGSEKKSYCCCSCCTALVLISSLICFGVLFGCLAAGFIPLLDDIFHDTVKKESVLKNGSDSFDQWRVPPAPVYMKYYLFNYTNVDEFLKNKSVKPRVEQLGPYSYREYKVNDVLSHTEDDITYLTNTSYVFDPETSCNKCTENDTIITPNIAVITVMSKVKDLNITNPNLIEKGALKFANLILNADKDVTLFKTLTFYQIIWGHHESFLDRISLLEKALRIFGFKLPAINPFVALQYNTTQGEILGGNATILTGKSNINDVQVYTQWKGYRKLPYWRTKYGNMINGTDGTRFHPFMSRDEVLYVFNNQLCRSIYLNYDKDVSMQDISMYRYTTLSSVFANHSVNPDNYAFCGPTTCWGAGLLEVSQCQDGNPPIFVSSPHFYQGADFLIDAIDGMKPEARLHETYLALEPITGVIMDARKRLQVNINARPSLWFDVMKPLPNENNFLPIMYAEEGGTIDKENADKFKNLVMVPKTILTWIPYVLFILAGVFIISALAVGLHAHAQSKKFNKYSQFDTDYEEQPNLNGHTNSSYVT